MLRVEFKILAKIGSIDIIIRPVTDDDLAERVCM